MRRADRLFRIVEILKARRSVVKAEEIAREVEVSTRTIYRDIADLGLSGVPVIGEAGVGYMLDRTYVLRPLMFDMEELDALLLGAEMVKSMPDAKLSKAAQAAVDKISAVVPERVLAERAETVLFSFPSKAAQNFTVDFGALRLAVRGKRFASFTYSKENGESSLRRVRPLALAHFSPHWLLLGWCEKQDDFRNFRLDRMSGLIIAEEQFRDERGKRLSDFLKKEEKARASLGRS